MSDSSTISFVSYFSFASKRFWASKVDSYLVASRVGVHLAVSAPPGTVRAPLDAYGSTSDNTERAFFSEAKLGLLLDDLRWYLRHRSSQQHPDRVGDRVTLARKPSAPCLLAMKICCCRRSTDFSRPSASRSGSSRVRPEFHLRQWVSPPSTRVSLITSLLQFYLHFFGNRGIRLHPQMAGNYPRISGITLSLGLVHYPLLFAPHQYTLLVQSSGSVPPLR